MSKLNIWKENINHFYPNEPPQQQEQKIVLTQSLLHFSNKQKVLHLTTKSTLIMGQPQSAQQLGQDPADQLRWFSSH